MDSAFEASLLEVAVKEKNGCLYVIISLISKQDNVMYVAFFQNRGYKVLNRRKKRGRGTK